MNLPTVEDALATMLARIVVLPTVMTPLTEADGRWLAQDVVATRDQPPFDASAMDGWAVRHADAVKGAELVIVGESAAGHGLTKAVGLGQAARISTGAPLPDGADHVVIQEEAERVGGRVRLLGEAPASSYVRGRGCDFQTGQRLLAAGQRLNPWRIALAASAGLGDLKCGARPRVAILATGDELVLAGATAGQDQIFDACSPALTAFVTRQGGLPQRLPIAADSEGSITAALGDMAFDVLVTVGGASVGEHDRVKPTLRALGAVLHVEGVAMRPGKPVWFAVLPDGRPVLGLPGNPASALVCAALFLAPVLARLQGGDLGDPFQAAVVDQAMPTNGARDHYVRATANTGPDGVRRVTPFGDQDSSLVTVMAAADVLIRRPPHAPAIEAGAVVPILRPM